MAIVVGNNASNNLVGTACTDLLIGKGGNDVLTGGKGYDLISGGKGDDVIVSVDADLIDGGKGNDTVVLLRESSTLSFKIDMSSCLQILADKTIMMNVERLVFFGGSGNDTIKGGALDDIISGGAGTDLLYGGAGNDTLLGNATDKLYGGDGNDVLSISALPALVDGGAGNDILRVTAPMVFSAGVVTNIESVQVVDGYYNFVNSGAGDIVNFDKFYDPPGTITTGVGLKISVVSDTILGEPDQTRPFGANILGSSHDDTITGGTGGDFLVGGRGDDIIYGGAGSDSLNGGTGLDKLYGGDGDDFIFSKNPDGKDLLLDGGDGNDYAQIERTALTSALTVDVSDTSGAGVVASDGTRIVSIEKFYIEGTAQADTITTGAGNDRIHGNAGNDTLSGGAGDDWISGGAGNDVLFGGDGVDFALYKGSAASYSWSLNSDGSWTVTDLRAGSPEGTDILWGFEGLTFDNYLPTQGHDFLL